MKKILISFITIVLCLVVTNGCSLNRGNEELAKKAIKYFCDKYNIDENDVEIFKNSLYRNESERECVVTCDTNNLQINYNNQRYEIMYDMYNAYFSDNYQSKEIRKDLSNHIKNKYSNYYNHFYLYNVEEATLNKPLKYEGDIRSYVTNINALDSNSYNHQVKIDISMEIKANDENDAKRLYNGLALEMVNDFESLNSNFSIYISTFENDKTIKEYYEISEHSNKLSITDKVDNQKNTCDKGSFDGIKCQ